MCCDPACMLDFLEGTHCKEANILLGMGTNLWKWSLVHHISLKWDLWDKCIFLLLFISHFSKIWKASRQNQLQEQKERRYVHCIQNVWVSRNSVRDVFKPETHTSKRSYGSPPLSLIFPNPCTPPSLLIFFFLK